MILRKFSCLSHIIFRSFRISCSSFRFWIRILFIH